MPLVLEELERDARVARKGLWADGTKRAERLLQALDLLIYRFPAEACRTARQAPVTQPERCAL